MFLRLACAAQKPVFKLERKFLITKRKGTLTAAQFDVHLKANETDSKEERGEGEKNKELIGIASPGCLYKHPAPFAMNQRSNGTNPGWSCNLYTREIRRLW